jgi:DNA-binding response OmpR family regulator
MQEGRLAFDSDATGIEWLAKPIDQVALIGSLERLIHSTSHTPTRVLHVEDDHAIHEVVRRMAGTRFSFQHVTTLREARARVSLERFDVVLLDLAFPSESGWDLLPEIRRHQPEARVVILSETDLKVGQVDHADAFLRKTLVSPRELMAAIGGHRRDTNTTRGLQ